MRIEVLQIAMHILLFEKVWQNSEGILMNFTRYCKEPNHLKL